MTLRLPHPIVLLLGGLAVAAAVTWLLPAGDFDRRDDPATGRRLVVAGTYHAVPPTPASPFAAAVAIPEGFVDAADVIAVVLFVGGAWIVLDKLGTLNRLVGAIASRFERRSLFAIPLVACAFASMGALENMQEEIIPLVPVLLAFGSRLGLRPGHRRRHERRCGDDRQRLRSDQSVSGRHRDEARPIAAVLERRPPRISVYRVSHRLDRVDDVARARVEDRRDERSVPESGRRRGRDVATLFLMLLPMAIYIYGAAKWDWGFNQLSAGFILGGSLAGLAGGLGVGGTVAAYLEGMQAMLPAALLVGVARSISVVLGSGHVIDTILWHLSEPLQHVGPMWAAAADGAVSRAGAHRDPERQRTRGADDAAARAAVGSGRASRASPPCSPIRPAPVSPSC